MNFALHTQAKGVLVVADDAAERDTIAMVAVESGSPLHTVAIADGVRDAEAHILADQSGSRTGLVLCCIDVDQAVELAIRLRRSSLVPIVAMCRSWEDQELRAVLMSGVNSAVIRPGDRASLGEAMRLILLFWLGVHTRTV